jgi:hypothetical protein
LSMLNKNPLLRPTIKNLIGTIHQNFPQISTSKIERNIFRVIYWFELSWFNRVLSF